MSKKSLIAKVDFMLEMLEMCENIEEISKRHGGIVKALEDFEIQNKI